ncbi:hypothetical protein PF005_g19491 [Phytophthora fragariae]|uniref:Uncharacterized protein n=1 Tax=Phytophthora fragariae TaxID=53985 RepID=A0A6A3WS15_9STRA|nr:hypothetical protein PF005_g19491 [Phytophthora fragariae]KAE9205122.1 hypothetical protein PF002_g20425 [Phytophthora fragariae]
MLQGQFALLEEQIEAKNEATSLEDSFAWCGWHNDHGALTSLVQIMLTGARARRCRTRTHRQGCLDRIYNLTSAATR